MMRYAMVLALVGCGGSVCKRDSCGEPPTDAEIEACEKAMEGCSGADEKLMIDFQDCMENDTNMCTPESASTGSLEAMGNCLAPLSGLSEECKTSQGLSSGS